MRVLKARSRTRRRWSLGSCSRGLRHDGRRLVALNLELMADAIAGTPQLLRKGYEEAIDDRRFAEAIYRVALASGLMEQVGYQDTIAESG